MSDIACQQCGRYEHVVYDNLCGNCYIKVLEVKVTELERERDEIQGRYEGVSEGLVLLKNENATLRAENERYKDVLAYLGDCGEIVTCALEESGALSADYCKEQREEREGVRAENAKLRDAITQTLSENLHLADGEVCTLIHLKRAIGASKLNELMGGGE